MALRGNLKDFSLPDVFQLVQLSRKTGVLRIAGAEGEGSIWFREGEVFFAQSDWRTDRFGERLVNAQRITPAALERGLEIQTAEAPHGRRLGEILVAEGYITRQVLETFVLDQIQDTIFDLMRWDEGRFDFEVLPEVLHEDIGLAVSVENIVMEGSRRLEEWQRVRKKVPSMDMVFKMATAPGEGTFEISLKPAEWSLLLLIDGTRSVHDLALETRAGDFDVARIIYGLFSAGLLEVVNDAEVAERRAERGRRDTIRATSHETLAVPAADESTDVLAEELADATPSTEALSDGRADFERGFYEPSASDELAGESDVGGAHSPVGLAETTAREVFKVPDTATDVRAHQGLHAAGSASADEITSGDEMPSLDATEGSDPGRAETPDVSAPPVAAANDSDSPDVSGSGEPDASVVSHGGTSPDATRVWTWETPVPTGDLTKDLMALGLGEYPKELLPRGSESDEALEDDITEEPSSPLIEVPATERVDIIYSFESAPVTPEPDLPALQFTPEGEAGAAPVTVIDRDSAVKPLPPINSVTEMASVADPPTQVVLRPESPHASATEGRMPIISTAPFVGETSSSEDHADTERESGISSGAEELPYVSTDAFLADLDGSMSCSGGLGDERAELTGAGPSRPRPQGAPMVPSRREARPALRRDHAVDRTLLIRIIEGIERL